MSLFCFKVTKKKLQSSKYFFHLFGDTNAGKEGNVIVSANDSNLENLLQEVVNLEEILK